MMTYDNDVDGDGMMMVLLLCLLRHTTNKHPCLVTDRLGQFIKPNAQMDEGGSYSSS